MGRPAQARHLELVRQHVDRDHRMGAGERGELHDRQADAAGAEHHHRLADLHVRVVADDAGRGGDRAAEQRRDLEIEIGGDHRHPVLRDDGVVVEGRHPAGVELRAAPAVGGGRALDALARAPMQHHGVARLDVGDAGSGLDHRAGGLVAEQVREELVGALGRLDLVDLRAADRRVQDLHQHLADVERLGKFDLVDDQRLARLGEDGGLGCPDFHGRRPLTRNR